MAIYTKRGDKGKTSLFTNGVRIGKDSLRISAIGSIDELNSFIGILGCHIKDNNAVKRVINIQIDLLTIGSILGGSDLRFNKNKIGKFEKEIDILEKILPKLTNFIVPGGSETASYLHFARTLTRRAEREVVALSRIEKVPPKILIYLNRLSDYFFMLARNENQREGVGDLLWTRK